MASPKIFLVGIALSLSLVSTELIGQSSAVRQAEKKIAQGNWSAAHQILIKSIRKDTINPEIEANLAKWFLNAKNPEHQVDSAYKHCLKSLAQFSQLTPRQREKLKREQVDSISVLLLRAKIDSAAFDQAKRTNTEKSYNDFLSRHLYSAERVVATELRDEAAYLDALKQNTYTAFSQYVSRYPSSHRVGEAQTRYEKLLYETKTRDRKLSSYESFVKDFPNSPHRRVAMKNIFESVTSGGRPADFIKFIGRYPSGYFARQARDILFYLARESEEKFPDQLITDSLSSIIQLDHFLWAPTYKNGKFGFINSEGVETIPNRFQSISENYKCGSISDDILLTNEGLVSRSGKVLSRLNSFKDLGYGFVKLTDSCASVMHKSGRMVVTDCVDDAWIVGGRFLCLKKSERVGLCALNGRIILPPEWHSIEMFDDLLVLDRNGKKVLVKVQQLELLAEGNALQENFVFDDVRSLGKNRLLVSNGSLQGVINSNLEFVIPLSMQVLSQTPFGLVRKLNDQFAFVDLPELKNESWDNFRVHRQWLFLHKAAGEKLFDTYAKKIVETDPDSLWFANGLAFARVGDSLRVHINSSTKIALPEDSKTIFIKSPDSIRFFFTELKGKKKVVFNIATGEKMFTADFDQIESLNAFYFIVIQKNKKGLINASGKSILPTEYDALILNSNQLVLLKEKKFGLYNLDTKTLIKPTYEKNILPLGKNLLIAFQDGKCGLLDKTGKPITAFEFDEIQPWNEDQVWCKKDFEWSLMDFRTQRKTLSRIKNYYLIKNQTLEKLAIVKQENFFGVVSSVKGVIIPPSFSFLMNLGDEDEPFYFTSKEVEEAGVVVVIYYDKDGNFLRKQVYEDEEYTRIVCPQD